MFKQIATTALLALATISFSQEESTTIEPTSSMGGEGTLTFSSTGFGDYYSGGGLGSTTLQGLLNLYGNKTNSKGGEWNNSLRIDYGIAKVENTNNDNFLKSSDVLDFISKYGIPVNGSEKWFYSSAFNVLTQLTETPTAWDDATMQNQQLVGLNGGNFGTSQSSFFSPADISLGLGFDYKPNDNFSAYISPAAGKLRLVNNDLIAESGLFGNEVVYDPITNAVTSFDNTRFELGANLIANYNDQFLSNDMLSFSTGLKLFSNYLEDPQNVDVNWNTVTSLNPWKFITLTYSTDLAYDDNKSFTAFANGEPTNANKKGVQFRNVLGIGLIHKFGDSKE